VIHGTSILTVKSGLEFIHCEKAVSFPPTVGIFEALKGTGDGLRAEERVRCMRHEISVSGHILEIISDDQIHAHKVPADFGATIPDKHSIRIHEAIGGKDFPGISVDDDLVDRRHLQQGIQDPAEKGLAGEGPEILSGDPRAVGLHGE
jgi:hypothetical protein